jgi:sulfate adenylyltransferase subunit 1
LATAGSVDDGKSTLVGRLLYDTKSVLSDQWEAVEATSRRRGQESADLALLTDGLRAEREQGITIDVAYRYFATPRRSFILADTPGHVQYTRNMATGAATADLALILVDARHGVVEQTRRHAAIAALLGVRHLTLAVNKMDLVGWAELTFDEIVSEFTDYAVAHGVTDIVAIPVSALLGDNVVTRSDQTPWYDGPTLLEHLETVDVSVDTADDPFRFPVQYVIRPQTATHPDYRGYAGRVASGSIAVGDEVLVVASGLSTKVVGIDTADGPLPWAGAGQSVTLLLADDLDISRGDLLAELAAPPRTESLLEATVVVVADRPLVPRQRVWLKLGTATVPGLVAQIHHRLDITSLEAQPDPGRLSCNDIGTVQLHLAEPLGLDDYRDVRATGRFLVIDPSSGATLAAGMVGRGTLASLAEPDLAADPRHNFDVGL